MPEQAGLANILLVDALNAHLINADQKPGIASKLLDVAIKSRDARAWTAELYVLPSNNLDVAIGVLRQAWQETQDATFAGSILALKFSAGQLTADDADLQAALKQFPEDGSIQHVRYELAKRDGKLTKQLLADAARAEFRHFSSFMPIGTVVNRPRSGFLREYFRELAKLPVTPHAKV